ncbi:extracellular solute-binding protein [Polycladidibacter hongkongensis]|uniref:extracellular solute-binding protein n=1 Tax=Polycladidibacter hongkongensis TaxID=1647556 RepID=UPI00082DC1BC|nr:extracellular solute-binding protein [Pseudovibrio hongkongensis]
MKQMKILTRHSVVGASLLLLLGPLGIATNAAPDEDVPWRHAIAMHGEPALPANIKHFPYVNPKANKDGNITFGVQGTFNSLNSYALKGAWTSARGMREREMGSNVLESLLARSYNEPFSLYAHLAEAVRLPEDRSWIEFRLNPKARFSNGDPVTVADIIFSLQTIRDHGRPPYRGWYAKIKEFKVTGERSLKLVFENGDDRELPLLISLAPIFNSRTTNPQGFEATTLTPPIGSGPYTFKVIEPGRRTVYERDPNYWAKDLPQKTGFDNFKHITVDYYRDYNALQEAFRKGDVDVLVYSNPSLWQKALDFPAGKSGEVVKDVFARQTPANFLGIAFNTRKDVFKDKRVRQALAMLFDFKAINRTLFSDLYQRTGSYWQNSELSALGHPAGEWEKTFFAKYPDLVEPEVMQGTWRPTEANGSGRDRKILRAALQKLQMAGYQLENGSLKSNETGEQLSFELLVRDNDEEKVGLSLKRTLKLVGIVLRLRRVDAAQFEERRVNFQFDAVFNTWFASLSPGGEQYARWSSNAADTPGSRNIVGAKEPAIDALIDAMVGARDREEFVQIVRAFDRVLISGAYAIPLYHAPAQWYARWTHLQRPETTPLYGVEFDIWWANNNLTNNQ